MDNENAIASSLKRKNITLKVYAIILGIIDIALLFLVILTFASGMSELVMEVFTSIFYGLFYLITKTSFDLVYWYPAMQFFVLSLLLILFISLSVIGAYRKKKWGRTINIFLLGIVFPLFVIIPAATIWLLPHAEYYLPLGAVCSLALALFIFDVYFFFWFLKNEQLFE